MPTFTLNVHIFFCLLLGLVSTCVKLALKEFEEKKNLLLL